MNAVSMLMLMLTLAQVNAFRSSHYQTLIKHSAVQPQQVEYDDVFEMNLSVHSIILEVNLWLNFFNLWLLRA